jgi:NAD(P)-dependent dehydrogenase (short-subunit alcohol dehydrogenase family)
MILDDVTVRVEALVAEVGGDAQVGFHGHDNLGIAVANSVLAVRAGAVQIDGSTRGFGAGAGNTRNEVLAAVCDRLGIRTGIDVLRLIDAAEDVVRPVMDQECIIDRLALVMGYAGVYSSFLRHAYRAAEQYGVSGADILRRAPARRRPGGPDHLDRRRARRRAWHRRPATGRRRLRPTPMTEYAVVAGATGALGSAIVRRLRGAGLAVVAVARSADDLARLAEGDAAITALAADLTDDAAIGALARTLDGPVRMLVQAAGLPPSGTVETITADEIRLGIDAKLGGLVRLLRGAEDRLGEGARIVVLGGHYGYEPSPAAPLAGIANAALGNFVRSLADHWGPRRVTVHMIAPGPVDSPRMRAIAARSAARRGEGVTAEQVLDEYRAASPLGRLTTIDEVAWAVGVLLTPEAAALHGSTLSLDLGRRRGIG